MIPILYDYDSCLPMEPTAPPVFVTVWPRRRRWLLLLIICCRHLRAAALADQGR